MARAGNGARGTGETGAQVRALARCTLKRRRSLEERAVETTCVGRYAVPPSLCTACDRVILRRTSISTTPPLYSIRAPLERHGPFRLSPHRVGAGSHLLSSSVGPMVDHLCGSFADHHKETHAANVARRPVTLQGVGQRGSPEPSILFHRYYLHNIFLLLLHYYCIIITLPVSFLF